MAGTTSSDAPLLTGTTIRRVFAQWGAAGAPAGGAPPAFLRHCLVRWLDAALRHYYGIHEFSDRPDCVLRIALGRAGDGVQLGDGSYVPRGAEVLELHLWNEHLLPNLPAHVVGLGRTSALRRRIAVSLRELAGHLQTEPSLARVAAVRARAAFVPNSRVRKLLRVVGWFGFDAVEPARAGSFPIRLHDFWENFLLLALAWTFNPAALRGNGVMRGRCELWVSREAFIARYGQGGARRADDAAPPAAVARHHAPVSAQARCAGAGRVRGEPGESCYASEGRGGSDAVRWYRFPGAGSARHGDLSTLEQARLSALDQDPLSAAEPGEDHAGGAARPGAARPQRRYRPIAARRQGADR